jgi:hypothetical protein
VKPTDLDRILDKKLSDITVREAFLAVRVFLRCLEDEESPVEVDDYDAYLRDLGSDDDK